MSLFAPEPEVKSPTDQAIEESVARFEQRLAGYGSLILTMARANGDIEAYRKELRAIVELAHKHD